MKLFKAVVIFWLAAIAVNTQGQNLIQNGSFESGTFIPSPLLPDAMRLGNGSTAISDWVVGATVSSNTVWLRTPVYKPENGNFCVELLSSRSATFSFIEQTFATVPGEKYVVSGYFGNVRDEFAPSTTAVQINGNTIGTATTPSQKLVVPPISETIWTNESFVFTATGTTSTLKFEDSVSGGGTFLADDTLIDNVSVQAVPDTGSTTLMFSIALGGLGWFGRRRIKSPACK